MKIGIIGIGNMGSVIVHQLEPHYQILGFDKDKKRLAEHLTPVIASATIRELVEKADVLILAVKPQDFDGLLKEIRNCLKGKLIVTIAAGITTGHIEKIMGNTRVVRAMPNLAAKIGESVTCISKGSFASEEDLSFVQELFYYLGSVRVIDETMMNAATAIASSGLGYIFDFLAVNSIDPQNVPEHQKHDIMKRLEGAAEAVGFSREDAAFLAAATTNSSLNLIKKLKIPAAELRDKVASKGGVTEAALEVIHKGGTWQEAVLAGVRRAEQLTRR
jgi:pyrroline-5-carboxylate reductase